MGSIENPLVRIRDLRVAYSVTGDAPVIAVDGISLEIGLGETVGVLGESGCGKSTLAKAISGMLPPRTTAVSGSILIGTCDLLTASDAELRAFRGRQFSLIPQDPALSLNPVITVGTQIAEVLRAHLPLRATERRARAFELLVETGFDRPEDIYNAYPHQLSGGQRQRIAIAQAVACRPPLVIADEPTSKLDPPLQAEIITLLSRLCKNHGTAILLISHDPSLFLGFADRIAVMYAGRIVEVSGTNEIFRHALHPYTQALIEIATAAVGTTAQKRLPAIDGESPDPATLPAGCRFETRCPERMEICTRRYPQVFHPESSREVSCFKYGE